MQLSRQIAGALFLGLAFPGVLFAQNDNTPRMPSWEDEISKGCVPYHQLTVEDFRIDDTAKPASGFWVKPCLHPFWHFVFTRRDWYYAYVDEWVIFSGFDKNESSRKSKFGEMKKWLPYAQAYVDLNEIQARQLAALKPGELPSGRGATPEEAAAALKQNMDAFLKEKYKQLEAEAAEFQKATNGGSNTKKVRELGNALRKRLEAIPAPTGPPSDSAPMPSSTPAPQTPASPAKTRGLPPPL
jgi:hypothetical protein